MQAIANIGLKLFIINSLVACDKTTPILSNIDNNIQVYGHGGMGSRSLLSMNSYRSIEKCKELGIKGTELDIQLTKDSQLVCYHGLLNNQVIANYTFNEIKEINKKILSLDTVITSFYHPKNFPFIFDLEIASNEDNSAFKAKFIRALSNLISAHQLNNTIIETNDSSLINDLNLITPKPSIFFLTKEIDYGFDVIQQYQLDGISTHIDELDSTAVDAFHTSNIYVAVWAVSTKIENNKALNIQVDIIQGDCLKDLKKKTDRINNN